MNRSDRLGMAVHLRLMRLGRISFEVLQELYATLTRKLVPQFDVQEARALVRDLTAWQPVAADLALLERA